MKIEKRNGSLEQLSFDKIIYRLRKLCNDKQLGVLENIDPDVIAQRVVSSIYDGVTSCELDEEAARIAISMTENLEYQQLASRIIISNMQKSTMECFSEVMETLYNNTDVHGKHTPILADDVIEIIRKHKNELNFAIDYKRDYKFDYFGYKTLERSYLLKIFNKEKNKLQIAERPQHMYMRVAVGIHKDDIESVLKTYNLISQHYYTHASPTLFNAGTRLNQYSSCFLLGTHDSLEGIFKTVTDCGKISKLAGGIGLHVTNIRAKGSIIRGTNGRGDGLVPMLKVYNEVCKYINQGGKRKGSFAIYLEPWHADIMEFLDLRKNQGHDDVRARDLFYAMWMPDLFMKQVECDGDWYLMCPDECPNLNEIYGEEFEKLYWKYVEEKKYRKQIKAQDVWKKIMDAQIETGVPYIAYKDAVNKKCNQKNLGTIKSSNLCCEISIYSDDKSYGVCNLCSIALPKYVEYDENGKPFYNFEKLYDVARYVVGPMNKVIDNNYYPTPETKDSNMAHRPLGIGVQGLADVYFKMKMPFESKDAAKLNKEIFETLYYGCLKGSIEQSKKDGPYSSYTNSPFSEGKLQFDLAAEFDKINLNDYISGRWDWKSLKQELKEHGIRNSLLIALMPTASTAQIMGNAECLASGTKISLTNGLSYNIEDLVTNNYKVYGWNNNKITEGYQTNHLNQGIKETIKIVLNDTREIICTKDHKFLTTEGWTEAQYLTNNHKIICGPENTFDEKCDKEKDFELNTPFMNFDMKSWDNRQKFLAFSRLMGFVLSDGTINEGEIAIYPGSIIDANALCDDINLITGMYPKINKNTRGFRIRITGILKKTIETLPGIIKGRRVIIGHCIPDFLLDNKCPKSIIREFLAGHFGGDGGIPTLQTKYKTKDKIKTTNGSFSGLFIYHNTTLKNLNHTINIFKTFKKLLETFNIKSNISNPIKTKQSDIVSLKLRISPTTKFLERIGVRYCIEKQLKLTVVTSYWRLRESIIKQRQQILQIAKALNESGINKTDSLKNAIKTYSETNIIYSNLCIPSYDSFKYYLSKDVNQKTDDIKINILNCCEYLEQIDAKSWFINKHIVGSDDIDIPYFKLSIHSIHKDIPRQVWDLSIDKYNSFIANGIMVHNCFEPIDSCIFKRRVLSGEYMVVNKYLVTELSKLGLWSKQMKDRIIANDGSIQNIPEIPDDIKSIYKTVWEISMKSVIEQCSDRGVFVDQMQSMNLFVSNPTYKKLTSMHFYAWKHNLKTGMYYLRSRALTSAAKFSVDANLEKQIRDKKEKGEELQKEEQVLLCSLDNPGACDMCSG